MRELRAGRRINGAERAPGGDYWRASAGLTFACQVLKALSGIVLFFRSGKVSVITFFIVRWLTQSSPSLVKMRNCFPLNQHALEKLDDVIDEIFLSVFGCAFSRARRRLPRAALFYLAGEIRFTLGDLGFENRSAG